MVPLELCLCGSDHVVFCTLEERTRCSFSPAHSWDYFIDVYLDREEEHRGFDLYSCNNQNNRSLRAMFSKRQPWVSELRLELSARPPRSIEPGEQFPDEVYVAPWWDLDPPPQLPEHQVPLRR